MSDLDEIDPTFEADLKGSKKYVRIAAEWFAAKGFPVIVEPTFVRPDSSERSEYADHGDLRIIQRVEVKHREKLTFTCAGDFPYPTIIVDVAHAWDNAHPKPYVYMILNRDATHMALVYGRHFKQWTKEMIHSRNRDREHYLCPVRFVTFGPVT